MSFTRYIVFSQINRFDCLPDVESIIRLATNEEFFKKSTYDNTDQYVIINESDAVTSQPTVDEDDYTPFAFQLTIDPTELDVDVMVSKIEHEVRNVTSWSLTILTANNGDILIVMSNRADDPNFNNDEKRKTISTGSFSDVMKEYYKYINELSCKSRTSVTKTPPDHKYTYFKCNKNSCGIIVKKQLIADLQEHYLVHHSNDDRWEISPITLTSKEADAINDNMVKRKYDDPLPCSSKRPKIITLD